MRPTSSPARSCSGCRRAVRSSTPRPTTSTHSPGKRISFAPTSAAPGAAAVGRDQRAARSVVHQRRGDHRRRAEVPDHQARRRRRRRAVHPRRPGRRGPDAFRLRLGHCACGGLVASGKAGVGVAVLLAEFPQLWQSAAARAVSRPTPSSGSTRDASCRGRSGKRHRHVVAQGEAARDGASDRLLPITMGAALDRQRGRPRRVPRDRGWRAAACARPIFGRRESRRMARSLTLGSS